MQMQRCQVQLNVVRTYARKQKLYVWRTFRDLNLQDEQVGAAPLGLARMLAEIHRKRIRKVLVERSARLSEDAAMLSVLLQYFRFLRVTVIEAATGHVLTHEDSPEQATPACGHERLFECKKALSLLKRRVTRILTGTAPGRKPFGSLPGEEETLRRLIGLRARLPKDQRRGRAKQFGSRRSFRTIAQVLNDEGLKTRSGKAWTTAAVRFIIKQRRPGWLTG
jgi:hypothetical protein